MSFILKIKICKKKKKLKQPFLANSDYVIVYFKKMCENFYFFKDQRSMRITTKTVNNSINKTLQL